MNFERSPRNSFLPRNNKEHVSRIRWDYFQFGRRAPLSRWKFRIALFALLLVVVPTTAYFLAPTYVDGKSSPGVVHHVHSRWNMTCDACHVPNRSVDALATGKWNEFRCEQCHAGPAHHESAKLTDKQGCASCHRDHQGPDSAMTRSPDSDCTTCHANLIESYKDEFKAAIAAAPRYGNVIDAFHTNHPEFAIVAATKSGKLEPEKHRSLKFNHAMHLTSGISTVEGAGKLTIGDLKDPNQRERYRAVTAQVTNKPVSEVTDSTKVLLNCASCHALDASQQQPALETVFPNPSGIRPEPLHGTQKTFDLTKAIANLPSQPILPPRQKGEYFLPSVYEQHCAACHPLRFDPALPNEVMPHRLATKDINTFMERVYSQMYAKDLPVGGGGLPPRRTTRLDPRLDYDAPTDGAKAPTEGDSKKTSTLGAEIALKVEQAERNMYTIGDGCIKCHDLKTESGKIVNVKGGRAPVVWMEHSRFNHASHHAMTCIDCHPGAYAGLPDIKSPLLDKGPLDLPGIDNCKQCHAPMGTNAKGESVGGVRANCTDCHTYHNGDHALAGPGDPSRAPKGGKTYTVREILLGIPKE